MEVQMSLSGGCYCGAVRYEARGQPFNSTLCHCVDCRKASGAPVFAWFSVETSGLHWTAGAPRRFRSSGHAERSFCPDCGTTLTWQDDRWPDEIDIATASLDDPEQVRPGDHTYVRSRLSWMTLHDGLPVFEQTRSLG